MISLYLTGCSIKRVSNSDMKVPDAYLNDDETTYLDISAELDNFVSSDAKEIPIYLKMGHLFILYSYPKPPYMENGRLMVSAKLPEDLMGGKYYYDEKSQKATIDLLGHKFEFEVDSTDAFVDGKVIKLDVNPTVERYFLYIPIDHILSYTDIKWSWVERDEAFSYLHIEDSRVIKGYPFDCFLGNDCADIIDSDALDLISYKLDNSSLEYASHRMLMIKGKNISGIDIPPDGTDINPLIAYFANAYGGDPDGGFSIMPYSRNEEPLFPIVRDGEVIVKVREINFSAAAYIISPGRRRMSYELGE